MEDYSMLLKLIENLGKEQKSFPDSVTLGQAHKAIEDLTAEIRDKDYLIQQQADEIERLRLDVKKQQEKMFELAKKLPKRGEWTEIEDYDGDFHYQCSVCGEEWYFIDGTPSDNNANYCPRCGAKMEVQDEAVLRKLPMDQR